MRKIEEEFGTFISYYRDRYVIIDDVVFSIDKKKLVRYSPEKADESYVIPEHVETICDGAFQGSEHPENLSLLTLFRFNSENESFLNEGDISFLEIMLERKKKKVCSSGKYSIKHSVQILELLRKNDNPLRICDIVELTGICDRRTIVRNISKLIDSGFDIRRDENKGYYIPKAQEILTSKDIQLIRESIELNCRISPEEKERILQLLLKL